MAEPGQGIANPVKTVTILLPTLNESAGIEPLIDELPISQLKDRGYEVNILVIDGGSTDRTCEIAEAKGANVMIQHGKGKGNGVRQAISTIDTDYLFMLDADMTYPPWYILGMLESLETGYDVVSGSRLNGHLQEGAMSSMNYFGNRMLTLLANTLYGTRMTDVCTGLWGFNRRVLENLALNARHFDIEAEIFATCTKNKYRMAEMPIAYKKRSGIPKLRPIAGISIAKKLIGRRFISLK